MDAVAELPALVSPQQSVDAPGEEWIERRDEVLDDVARFHAVIACKNIRRPMVRSVHQTHVDPALNTRAYSWLRLRLRWLDEDQRATKRWAAAFHHARAPAMSDYKQCSTTPATRLR